MRTIKLGVCGLGRIGTVHCRHFSQDSQRYELVAVCDHDDLRISQITAEYQCAGYSGFEDFLNHADMELVIIATRSLDHATHAAQALASEKYVLLEKPIAVTDDDFQMLKKADKEYPGKLFPLHNHRFEPAFQNISKVITSGVLGDIQLVKLCRHHPFRFRNDWQSLLDCGGGQLSCWGPHVIDHALQFLKSPVKDLWSNLKRINTPGDADDHVKIMMVGENGIVVDLEISDAVALPGDYCTVYGNRGSLICADEKYIQLKYMAPEFKIPTIPVNPNLPPENAVSGNNENIPWVEKTIKVQPDTNMWAQVEIDMAHHLCQAIRKSIPFPVTNTDALEIVRITSLVKKQNPQFDWKY